MKKLLILPVTVLLVVIGVFGYTKANGFDKATGQGTLWINTSSAMDAPGNDIVVKVVPGPDVYVKNGADLGAYTLDSNNRTASYSILIRNNTPGSGELPEYKIKAKSFTGNAERITMSIAKTYGDVMIPVFDGTLSEFNDSFPFTVGYAGDADTELYMYLFWPTTSSGTYPDVDEINYELEIYEI